MEIMKKSQFTSPVVVLPHDTDPAQMKYDAWQKLRDSGMTVNQIAKLFNVSGKTIYNHTECRYDWRATNCGAYAREAKEARKAYYVPLMLELRKLGYSNAEIGKKTGFHYITVLRYIGEQPDEIVLASHRAAGAKIRFRNLAVKNQPCRDANEPIPAVAEVLKTA